MNEMVNVNQSTGEIIEFSAGGSAQMAATLSEMEAKLTLVQNFFKRRLFLSEPGRNLRHTRLYLL